MSAADLQAARQSDVSELSPPRKMTPVTVKLKRKTLIGTARGLLIAGHTGESKQEVAIVLIYMPEGELHFEPIYVDGKLDTVLGFVPECARRATVALFRHNESLTLG